MLTRTRVRVRVQGRSKGSSGGGCGQLSARSVSFLGCRSFTVSLPSLHSRPASQRRAGRLGSSWPVSLGSRCWSWDRAVRGARGSRGCRVIRSSLPCGCFQDGDRLVGEEGGGEVRSPRVLMKRPPRSAGTSPALRVCVCAGGMFWKEAQRAGEGGGYDGSAETTFTVLQGRRAVRPCITYRASESLSFGSQVSKQHLPHQSNDAAVHPPRRTPSLLPNLCISPAFSGAAGVELHWRALRRDLPLLG